MSVPVAICHGPFGRVCLFSVDRAMVPHAHREGHLVFHVDGPPGELEVDGRVWPVSPGQGVAVSPWQPHVYRPLVPGVPVLTLVLYIRPAWFMETARSVTGSLNFGRVGVEVTDQLTRLVLITAHAMLDPDRQDPAMEDRLSSLTQIAYDQSWQWTSRGNTFSGTCRGMRDYRIRKALRLIQEGAGESNEVDAVAREVGLSRPHFYKLFREQVGVTPKLYLNTLLMERAIERLADGTKPVADIGFELGFSGQASFSRFFISNGVVAPSAYRRSAQVAEAG
jgi:AraC-like DNA-binding protein